MKLIGITSCITRSSDLKRKKITHIEGVNRVNVSLDYSRAVQEAGGVAFVIPHYDHFSKEIISETIKKLDGLILSGGIDVHPRLYSNKKVADTALEYMKSDEKRDLYEMALIEEAIQQKKPILGICRGIQLLNVYFGGTLYQDLNDEYQSTIDHLGPFNNKSKSVHSVNIKENTTLYSIYQSTSFRVNSFHHQGIKNIGKHIQVEGVSEDGLPEAVLFSKEPWVYGVQWHPEMLIDDERCENLIMRYFINKII